MAKATRSKAEAGVAAAVERDLRELARRAPGLAESALAASALVLAAELDDPENSATSKSMCARALTETMNRLLEMAPPEKEHDRLDELASRRSSRRAAGGSAATDLSRA